MTSGELILVKLGGSLLTDKTRPETARGAVLERLAAELAAAAVERPGALVIGHGSGSFGHHWAERSGLGGAGAAPPDPAGVAATQDAAARLHRRVVGALLAAGAAPFSFVPGSAAVADDSALAAAHFEPVVRALELGLLPVLHGDVVLDRRRGAVVVSTETVLAALATAPALAGRATVAWWLGVTPGILGADGRAIERITPAASARALGAAGPAAGTDVTGGMRHRLETALELARAGVPSLIVDGREPGVVARLLAGRPVPGSRVEAER